MNLLTEREWNVGYRNEGGDLIEMFYNRLSRALFSMIASPATSPPIPLPLPPGESRR